MEGGLQLETRPKRLQSCDLSTSSRFGPAASTPAPVHPLGEHRGDNVEVGAVAGNGEHVVAEGGDGGIGEIVGGGVDAAGGAGGLEVGDLVLARASRTATRGRCAAMPGVLAVA